MAFVKTDDQHYTHIAAAIRGKNGTSDTYTPDRMAAAIDAIVTGDPLLERDVLVPTDGAVPVSVPIEPDTAAVLVYITENWDGLAGAVMFWDKREGASVVLVMAVGSSRIMTVHSAGTEQTEPGRITFKPHSQYGFAAGKHYRVIKIKEVTE